MPFSIDRGAEDGALRTQLAQPLPRWVLGAFAVSMAAHVYGLYSPGQPEPVTWFRHADKAFHFVGFAVPATLAVAITRRGWPIAAFAGSAVLSELVQHYWLPHRDGSVGDLAADLLGLLPALTLYLGAIRAATSASRPTSRTSAASRRPKA